MKKRAGGGHLGERDTGKREIKREGASKGGEKETHKRVIGVPEISSLDV